VKRSEKDKPRAECAYTHSLNNLIDQPDARHDLLHVFTSHETVEIFLGVVGERFGTSLTLLDGAFATNANLRTTVTLHLLERVATRTDQESEEVDLGELLHRDVDLLLRPERALLLVVLDRRPEVWVVLHGPVDEAHTLILELLPVAHLARVGTTTMCIVCRWRGL
jgi:hypothetical protein